MKVDFRNILIGIIIGILLTIIMGCLVNDVYIDIKIGNDLDKYVRSNVFNMSNLLNSLEKIPIL